MKAVVFVGPCLPNAVSNDPQLLIAPPAVAGDVYLATQKGAQIIGLIDARFENEQTVRHDEILYALHRGVHVFGAASMGALRAVECARFGMRGLGRIFEMYRDGQIDGDHEVAVQYGPAELGWPTLSVPLVNVRITVQNLVDRGALAQSEALEILQAARAIYYKKLTWDVVLASVTTSEFDEKLYSLVLDGYVDQKALDAAELIDHIHAVLAAELEPLVPIFDFQPTVFWQQFAKEQSYRASQLSTEDAGVLDELRLDPIRYSDVLQRAFARRTANSAPEAAPSVSTPSVSAQLDDFRADFGLLTGQAYRAWLAANRTEENAFQRFLSRDARLEEVLEQEALSLETELLHELRAEDAFTGLDIRATDKRSLLGDRSAENFPDSFANFDLKDLLEWFCRIRRIKGDFSDPDDLARSLGLSDKKALHVLLRREFEYAQAIRPEGDGDS